MFRPGSTVYNAQLGFGRVIHMVGLSKARVEFEDGVKLMMCYALTSDIPVAHIPAPNDMVGVLRQMAWKRPMPEWVM